jgi:hypothetical protein
LRQPPISGWLFFAGHNQFQSKADQKWIIFTFVLTQFLRVLTSLLIILLIIVARVAQPV